VRAKDGTLDRAALAAIVFAQPQARRELEALTHPCIRERIDAALERLAATPDVAGLVVLDHPLLVESGAQVRVDAVVVVEAPEPLRVRRLVRDRGMRRKDVRARIANQASDAERRNVAHHVILNDLGLAELEESVDLLLRELRSEAGIDESDGAGG
jgi:dephospho-CoA kinase